MPSATLGGYEPLLFDTLPAFDEAQANLTRFEPELGRLGGVVSRHGGDERLGLRSSTGTSTWIRARCS